ncbi:metallophosphoesterase [Desulfallas sp. Bu1-1]|jgi:hypothetical protein|uniref:metallophosphoesterase family protein n=1 Tax=Desulfallas sp. Bu1-1 TaxID=2787620 RepID=UPI00189E071E|nr:metallophosphoesterase [Desulfallas sp. Bu1-1]MBF7083126.1 metallophosphoesterase [Desulfallas sp. Bu1-1]
MRIVVFSDTHGSINRALTAVNKIGKFDALIHAGDHYSDAGRLASLLKIPAYAVAGNCDTLRSGPEELIITPKGCKIYITHGHLFRAKDTLQPLFYRAREINANVVVFGHTHVPLSIREESILLFNPGSTTRPVGGFKAGFGILTISDDNVEAELISI